VPGSDVKEKAEEPASEDEAFETEAPSDLETEIEGSEAGEEEVK
jgi:hypothetical protein